MFSGFLFLWFAGGLALNVPPGCSKKVFKIDSVETANAIQNCTILMGQVEIDISNTTGTFHLDNVQQIFGNLLVQPYEVHPNASNVDDEPIQAVELSMKSLGQVFGTVQVDGILNLVNISLPVLANVSEAVYLHDLPNLAAVDLRALDRVGAFVLNTLPQLQELELDAGISGVFGYQDIRNSSPHDVDPIVVVANTALTKLESFNFSTVAIFEITNNRNLKSISMALKETKRPKSRTSTKSEIFGNGDSSTTLSLPYLWKLDTEITAFRDLSSLDLPRLQKVEGSLVIGDNKLLETFNASMLREISNELTIEWNPNLSNVAFPVLRNLNSLIAQGTKALTKPDGLSMPNLRAVKDVYLGGDDSRVNCQAWDNKRCMGLVTKVYFCGSNWRHPRKIDIASDPNECKFIHPLHGWTRARKIRVCTRLIGAVAILTAILCTYLYYRQTLSNIDYRNVLRNAMAGEYTRVDDQEEEANGVEFDVRNVEHLSVQQTGSKNKPLPDKPLPTSPS